MKLTIFILLMMAQISAWAVMGGEVVGDGGHALFCPGSVKFLDLVEAQSVTGRVPSLHEPYGPVTHDFQMYLDSYIADLNDRAGQILGRHHIFLQTIEKISTVYMELGDFSDDQFGMINNLGKVYTEVPARCSIKQIAVRVANDSGEKVLINYSAYLSMSHLDVGMMLFHEALHSWFDPQETSLAARQTVWYLTADDEFRQKNSEAFIRLINTKQPQIFER